MYIRRCDVRGLSAFPLETLGDVLGKAGPGDLAPTQRALEVAGGVVLAHLLLVGPEDVGGGRVVERWRRLGLVARHHIQRRPPHKPLHHLPEHHGRLAG